MRYKFYNGFTLIEVLIAIILVGFAVAALVGANLAFTKANGAGSDLTTAEFLTEQIGELVVLTAYDNLSSLDGMVYSPPIDSMGQVLSDFSAYSQHITVENISSSDFQLIVADGGSDFSRVTVEIYLNSKKISSSLWIRAKY